MSQVLLFCDKVVVLNKGRIEYTGDPEEAVKFYLSEIEEKKEPVPNAKNIKPIYGDLFWNEDKISNVEHYWADDQLNRIEKAITGSEINLVIRFSLHTSPKNLVIGVPIWDHHGNYITGVSTDMSQTKISGNENDFYEVILNFPELILNAGQEYVSVVAINDGPEIYYRELNNSLLVDNYRRSYGYVTAPHLWKITHNPSMVGNHNLQ